MGLVYSYRSQFAQQLERVYQAYSYLLWGAFVVLMMLLNSLESPLMVNNVSAESVPVFNMLSLGWLLPAIALLVTSYKRWNTLQIHACGRQLWSYLGSHLARYVDSPVLATYLDDALSTDWHGRAVYLLDCWFDCWRLTDLGWRNTQSNDDSTHRLSRAGVRRT